MTDALQPAARIADLLRAGPTLSFEFFPPKTDAGVRSLYRTIDRLEALSPSFVSVTYGAGGSTRERTRDIVVEVNTGRPFPAMAHLTCVGHGRSQLEELLVDYRQHGVSNILALAGDPPGDGTDAGGDFRHAVELVELVREVGDFSIGVAAQPETHPRSPDRASDRRHLADKLRLADFGVTNFFFDADDHLRMIDELEALGCTTPVLPGVMPVLNPVTVGRFAVMNGSRLPEPRWGRLMELADDPAALLDAAVDDACELITRLQEAGVPGIHIYALNRPEASLAIADRLGLRGPAADRSGSGVTEPGG